MFPKTQIIKSQVSQESVFSMKLGWLQMAGTYHLERRHPFGDSARYTVKNITNFRRVFYTSNLYLYTGKLGLPH